MPSLQQRLTSNNPEYAKTLEPISTVASTVSPSQGIQTSPDISKISGVYVPNRSLLPLGFTYDFDVNKQYPTGFRFTRRQVGVNASINNTAIQALYKAFGLF